MPRAKTAEETSTTSNTSRAKAAPRKTTARTRTARTAATTRKTTATTRKPRTTRATAPKKVTKKAASDVVTETEVVTTESDTRVRKAPTKFAGERSLSRARRTQMIVVGVLLSIGIGASAAVGVTDAGQIDVAETIKARNARMATMVDVDGPVVKAPTPVETDKPDGGLVGLKPAANKPSVPRTPNELAGGNKKKKATTTPDGTASSTTPVVDGVITHSATTTVEAVDRSTSSPTTASSSSDTVASSTAAE